MKLIKLFINICFTINVSFSFNKFLFISIQSGTYDNQIGIVKKSYDYSCPHDFDIDSKGNVYMDDPVNESVKIFNKNAKLLKILRNNSRWHKAVSHITADHEGNVVFFDGYNSLIKINTTMNKIYFTNKNFSEPKNILIDKSNNIFISDIILSKKGERIESKSIETKAFQNNFYKFNKLNFKDSIKERNDVKKVEMTANNKMQIDKKQNIANVTDENIESFIDVILRQKFSIQEIRTNFSCGYQPEKIGIDTNGNTYWQILSCHAFIAVLVRIDKYGNATDLIVEKIDKYIKFVFKLCSDDNLYAYTPHKTDGVIIWKYTFDE